MKGGARTSSGPAPDPMALGRERGQGEWTVLPAEGRAGDPPAWPLMEYSGREQQIWDWLWRKPQALMWERYGQQLEVALYVRNVSLVERPEAPIALGTLVRQQSDSLGLTTPGLRNNRWKIARDEAAPVRTATVVELPKQPSARSRLTVVPYDGRE